MVVGTPGYISPEQAIGIADVRSDIYSLGAVGYFLLAGQSPFGNRRTQPLSAALVLEPTPLRELRPEVPAELEAIIHRCLRRNPEERFGNIHMVAQALAVCACGTSWNAVEASSWWRTAAALDSARANNPPGRSSTPVPTISD
jgi:serine/threonine-protein kinase